MQTKHDKVYQSQSVKAGYQHSYSGACVYSDSAGSNPNIFVKRNLKQPSTSFSTVATGANRIYCNWYTEYIYIIDDNTGTSYIYIYDFDGVLIHSGVTQYNREPIFWADQNGYHYRVVEGGFGDPGVYVYQFNTSEQVTGSFYLCDGYVDFNVGSVGFNLGNGDIYWVGGITGLSGTRIVKSNITTGGATTIKITPSGLYFSYIYVDYIKEKLTAYLANNYYTFDLDGTNEEYIPDYFLLGQSVPQAVAHSIVPRIGTALSPTREGIASLNTQTGTYSYTNMHDNTAEWDTNKMKQIALF